MIKKYALLGLGLAAIALLIRFGGSAGLSEDSGLRSLIIPVADLFLRTFNDGATALTLCVAMTLVGALLLGYYWFGRIGPAVRDLKLIAGQLRVTPVDGRGASLVPALDRIFGRYAVLNRSWKLYRRSLVVPAEGEATSRVPPSHYFNMRALELSGLRLRFFMGLPNDFVGIGLVFTFMGLVAGLFFASRSMMSGDLEVARAALNQLLHAATFKFLTSITGITVSLVISWAQRHLLDRLQESLDEIQFLLEERIPVGAAAAGEGLRDAPASASAPAVFPRGAKAASAANAPVSAAG